MPNAYDGIARRAAQRLSGDLSQNLPAAVEAELRAGGKAPERYEPVTTVIALAALLLNAAKFAWDIYRDRKKDAKEAPSAYTIARTLRLELKYYEGVSIEQRDKIINVVVEEVLKEPPTA
jgi:hypothetical protein